MGDGRPEVTGTRHDLPFGELAPRDFERLGLALLSAGGYEDVRHLGAAGQDGGIDLTATRDGRVVAVQCKRHERFGPQDAEAAVRELLSRPLSPPAESLLLLVSCDVTRAAEDRAIAAAGGLLVRFWAKSELDDRVHAHPRILERFFDLGSGRARPGPLVGPAPPARFTGRAEILGELRRRLVAGEDVGLTALQGMGGIGKTALALRLAKDLVREERDAFPGGVLWWQLGPEPDVLGALNAWARAAAPESDLSNLPDAASRAAAVRQLLGPYGRLCALLDDVWDATSARSLLEAVPAGCPRLVTTRDGDVARQLRCEIREVETLASREAVELFGKLVPGGIAGQEAAAERVAELAEGLPLALEIAAGLVDRAAELPDLAERLATRPRIEVLALAGHRQDSVEVCFTLSYRGLDPETQRRFRALGAFGDSPFDEAAVFAVWGLSAPDPESLRLLLRRHLVQWVAGGPRLRQHALLQSYARVLLDREGETEAAADRHAAHFRELVQSAPWTVVDASYEQVRHAWRQVAGDPAEAPRFSLAAVRYQNTRGRWPDRLEWLEAARRYSENGDDRRLHGRVVHELAAVYDDLGRKEEALRCYEEALTVRREVGDRGGEGTTLNNIAKVYHDLGRKEEALRRLEEALTVLREVGDRGGEGTTLNNIAKVYDDLGRKEEALRRYEEALTVTREVGDRGGEGTTLNNIAKVYSALGRKEEALRRYDEALTVRREVGDRGGEGTTLNNIAAVYSSLGRKEEALRRWEEALMVRREVGDVWGEAVTLSNIGWGLDSLGRHAEAVEVLEACVALDERIGHPDLASDRAFLETVRAKLGS